jgi:hypothetical protein
MAVLSTALDIITGSQGCECRMEQFEVKSTSAQLLNTFEFPQSYKCAGKRLKVQTNYIAQNSDVENRAYVEVWARGGV